MTQTKKNKRTISQNKRTRRQNKNSTTNQITNNFEKIIIKN